MKLLRLPRRRSTRLNDRAGLFAFNEVLIVVSVLAGLFWFGAQLLSAVTSDAASASAAPIGTSDHGVYRISLNVEGDKLWVFRPRDGVVQLNLATNAIERSVPLSGMELTAVAHSMDGLTTLLCGVDGSAILHCEGEESRLARVRNAHDLIVEGVVSHDGSVAVCSTADGEIVGWVREEESVREFNYRLDGASSLAKISLSSSGRRMCFARLDGTVTFHDSVTGVTDGAPLVTGGECPAFDWSDDEKLLAVASCDGRVRVYELATGTVICEALMGNRFSTGRPTTIAISPDHRWVAVSTNTSLEIRLWNIETGVQAVSLVGHNGIVRTMKYSPDSKRLFSGSYDGSIREWSLANSNQIRVVD